MVSGGVIHEEPSSLNFGLPSYQPNASQLNFDFSPMEDFATAEKVKLGLNSALTPKFVLGPTRRSKPQQKVSSQSVPTFVGVDGFQPDGAQDNQGDASAPEQNSPKTLRLRKLSQSNPQPRPPRRGIGGKMAIFEGGAHESLFNLPPRLGVTAAGHGGAAPNPSYENIVGPSVTGILNTGHDRPYRFSFYSNALSATIHARSLSELPAEGQTFEQLFSGTHPQPQENDIRPTSPAPSNIGKDRPSSSMNVPPYDPVRGLVNGSQPHSSQKRGGGPDGPDALHGDVSSWWLDVLSPTDEEMKMLSKVHFALLNTFIFIHVLPLQGILHSPSHNRGYPYGRDS
jgi:magnesium transporter